MQVNFKGWNDPQGPVANLFKTAIDFLADFLMEDAHESYAMDVVILADHYINDDGTASTELIGEGGDSIMGAVFFNEDVDTDQVDTFTLGIHPEASPGEIFLILAHEMVHVMQYVDKTLRTVKKGDDVTNWWEGVQVPAWVDYHDFPWEVQAYELQEPVLAALMEDPGFLEAINALR
jgi:hypothetical protein